MNVILETGANDGFDGFGGNDGFDGGLFSCRILKFFTMFLKSDGFDGFDGTGAGAHSDSPMGSFNVQWLPIGRPPRTERARGANSEAYGPGPGSWAHEPGPWTPGLWAWPGPWARFMDPGPRVRAHGPGPRNGTNIFS